MNASPKILAPSQNAPGTQAASLRKHWLELQEGRGVSILGGNAGNSMTSDVEQEEGLSLPGDLRLNLYSFLSNKNHHGHLSVLHSGWHATIQDI